MKLIILRDLLKLDFYESFQGLHGASILFKEAREAMPFKHREPQLHKNTCLEDLDKLKQRLHDLYTVSYNFSNF